MTATTTINGFLMILGPIFVTYNSMDLKKIGAYPICAQLALVCLIVSLLKMIALAFIYPVFISESELENEDVSVYSLKQEILKAIVNSLDLACLVFYFNY